MDVFAFNFAFYIIAGEAAIIGSYVILFTDYILDQAGAVLKVFWDGTLQWAHRDGEVPVIEKEGTKKQLKK